MDSTFVLLSFALSQASFSNVPAVESSLAWQARSEGVVVHSTAWETKFRSAYNGLWSGEERSLADETRVETQVIKAPLFFEVSVQTGFFQDFVPTYIVSNLGFYTELGDWLSLWYGIASKRTYTGTWLHEIGTNSGLEIAANFNGDIRLNTEFEVFQPLSGEARTWKDLDVRWDLSLTGSISKVLNASIEAGLLYDRDVGPKRRLRQLVMMGLSYKIGG